MPLVGLEPTSISPEKQGFSAGRSTDSGTVTDACKNQSKTLTTRRSLRLATDAIAELEGSVDG
jgi:hypothetical protein